MCLSHKRQTNILNTTYQDSIASSRDSNSKAHDPDLRGHDSDSEFNPDYVRLCECMTKFGVKRAQIRRALLDILDFTQRSLAERIDVTPMAISGALRDRASLSLKIKIAKALRVRVWDIFDVDIPH